jgi:hypothetical protein
MAVYGTARPVTMDKARTTFTLDRFSRSVYKGAGGASLFIFLLLFYRGKPLQWAMGTSISKSLVAHDPHTPRLHILSSPWFLHKIHLIRAHWYM